MSGIEPTQIPIAMHAQSSANALYRQTIEAASSESDARFLTLTLPASAVDALQSAIDESQPDYTLKVNNVVPAVETIRPIVPDAQSSSSSAAQRQPASSSEVASGQPATNSSRTASNSSPTSQTSKVLPSVTISTVDEGTSQTSRSTITITATDASPTSTVISTRKTANLGTNIKIVNTQITFGPNGLTTVTIDPTTSPTSSATGAPTPTGESPFFRFLRSLGNSGSSIALTVLVCLGIAALICASIAFCIRRIKRRERRGIMNIGYDRSIGKYSDIHSAYSDMQSINQVTLPRHMDHPGQPQQQQARPIPEIRYKDYDDVHIASEEEEWSRDAMHERRRSSLEASVINHLTANAPPMHTPLSIGSRQFDQGPSATAASSPYLEPPLGPALRSTYLGSFSASVPNASSYVHPLATAENASESGASRSPSLLAPPRPNRPASLTSSFKIAVEEHLADNPPEATQPELPTTAPLSIKSPLPKTTVTFASPNPQSAWGVKTISQVFTASSNAVKGLLSPATTGLASPSYDEEKADIFMDLPTNIPRRGSSRWGSFASQTSNDRRLHQQMPSRFSVTTLATSSPTPTSGSGSVYHDWQIRSALRSTMSAPRKQPELIAQRQLTPPDGYKDEDSDETLTDRDAESPVSNTVNNVGMHRTESGLESVASASTNPFAFNAPSTPQRPAFNRLQSMQESLFSQHDSEDDAWEMTAEEQKAMTDLIKKRQNAAMAAR